MIIRDAAIYICVFFLPLTFVAMIWPATSRWARRLVELLVAIILAKFVIVAILSLATAAITNTSLIQGNGNTVRADDRRRRTARPRRLVAVRAPPADPDDGNRGRQHRQPALVPRAPPQAPPASTAPPATCDRRWTGTHAHRPHARVPRRPAERRTRSRGHSTRASENSARRTAVRQGRGPGPIELAPTNHSGRTVGRAHAPGRERPSLQTSATAASDAPPQSRQSAARPPPPSADRAAATRTEVSA